MKFISFKVAAPVVALGFLLSGCGGGNDEGIFVDEKEPSSTGLSASVAVTAATDASAQWHLLQQQHLAEQRHQGEPDRRRAGDLPIQIQRPGAAGFHAHPGR